MVVECESCGTRFNLADAQVPEQGARVRCSKCHHRFHVMPAPRSRDAPSPPPASPAAAPGAASPPTPERDGDDPDLDNPEFLFDDSADAASPAAPARQDLGSSSAQLGAGEEDETLFGLEDEPREVRRESFGFGHSEELTSDPDEAAEPVGSAKAAVEEAAVGGAPDEGDAPAGLPADPLGALDADQAGVQIDSWDRFSDSARDIEAAPPAPSAPPTSTRRAPTAAAPAAAAPTAAEMDSLGARLAGGAVRLTAWVVGLALVAGGARVLLGHGVGPPPGPAAIHAHGWTASEIAARYFRDAEGRRVLVVRGDLQSGGSGPPPRVRAALLDSQGRVVVESNDALQERLDAAAVASLLDEPRQHRPALSGARPQGVRGFTLIVPEPPPDARRFRLALLPAGAES